MRNPQATWTCPICKEQRKGDAATSSNTRHRRSHWSDLEKELYDAEHSDWGIRIYLSQCAEVAAVDAFERRHKKHVHAFETECSAPDGKPGPEMTEEEEYEAKRHKPPRELSGLDAFCYLPRCTPENARLKRSPEFVLNPKSLPGI